MPRVCSWREADPSGRCAEDRSPPTGEVGKVPFPAMPESSHEASRLDGQSEPDFHPVQDHVRIVADHAFVALKPSASELAVSLHVGSGDN